MRMVILFFNYNYIQKAFIIFKFTNFNDIEVLNDLCNLTRTFNKTKE